MSQPIIGDIVVFTEANSIGELVQSPAIVISNNPNDESIKLFVFDPLRQFVTNSPKEGGEHGQWRWPGGIEAVGPTPTPTPTPTPVRAPASPSSPSLNVQDVIAKSTKSAK